MNISDVFAVLFCSFKRTGIELSKILIMPWFITIADGLRTSFLRYFPFLYDIQYTYVLIIKSIYFII